MRGDLDAYLFVSLKTAKIFRISNVIFNSWKSSSQLYAKWSLAFVDFDIFLTRDWKWKSVIAKKR